MASVDLGWNVSDVESLRCVSATVWWEILVLIRSVVSVSSGRSDARIWAGLFSALLVNCFPSLFHWLLCWVQGRLSSQTLPSSSIIKAQRRRIVFFLHYFSTAVFHSVFRVFLLFFQVTWCRELLLLHVSMSKSFTRFWINQEIN